MTSQARTTTPAPVMHQASIDNGFRRADSESRTGSIHSLVGIYFTQLSPLEGLEPDDLDQSYPVIVEEFATNPSVKRSWMLEHAEMISSKEPPIVKDNRAIPISIGPFFFKR